PGTRVLASVCYVLAGIWAPAGVAPSFLSVSSAARSTSVAGASAIQRGKKPTLSPLLPALGSKSRVLETLDTSPASGPLSAASTRNVSSTLRAIGPSLSSDQHSVIAPVRGTRPTVGRSPGTPQ